MNFLYICVLLSEVLLEHYSKTAGSFPSLHHLDGGVDIIQVVERSQLGLDSVRMAEFDRLPHSLRSAAAHSLDAIFTQQNIECIYGEVGLWNTNDYHESVDPEWHR